MSPWVRNTLILLSGAVGLFIVAYAAVALIAALYTGALIVPAFTQNNIWSAINVLILSVLVPGLTLLGYRLTAMIQEAARQSQQNSQKLDATIEKVGEIEYTVKNGGGQGVQAIRASVEQLVKQAERDPSSRERSTDGGAA